MKRTEQAEKETSKESENSKPKLTQAEETRTDKVRNEGLENMN